MADCKISCDWTYKGMKTLILENEYLRILSLLDKGSDIIEILYKPLDIDFLWHSPIGYRNPTRFVESCARSEGSFLDYYGGGWQDILPSAGLPSVHRGAEWGQHGESALIPWQCAIEKEKPEEVRAHLTVNLCRYPFSVDKWLILKKKEKSFTIKEKITNNSEQDLEFSWLQHVAFGEPFLKPNNVIDLAAGTSVVHSPEIPNSSLPSGKEFPWPRIKDKKGKQVDLSVIPGKKLRVHDLVYLIDVKDGWYALTNAQMKLTFGLVWDKNVFPHVWFWRPLGGAWDHPWFGRAWAIALEPCTSWPATGLADHVKKGTAAKIEGGSSIETEMRVVAHTDLSRVTKITREGTVKGVSG
jgi:galactose mutarotase-like enzyme